MSRIKEIGILRAIGVKKLDIYKMFASEIFVITTLTGIPGIYFIYSILKEFSEVNYISSNYMVNSKTFLISLIILYVFNLLIGLIPIRSVVKKTPAEILSRNDVD